ncbi:MAG: autotransporter-associated beta strand repeat-containing protein, partial [Prosthecobacter sp.]|nr:autotransporter-associated beta strand repeat-containing protein [Prosthecobacter sp.]
AGDNEFNIQLGDSPTGATALLKIGPGTWTLGKDASYTGLTTVQEGVLAVMNNNVLGTAATPTTANPAAGTFTGNLPNGVKVSFTSFVNAAPNVSVGSPSSVPDGIVANVTYYVVESNGTTFKVATTLGGPAVAFATTGVNVQYVANIKSIASTTADQATERFTGALVNNTPVAFNVRSFLGGAAGNVLTNGVLPTGVSSIITYYVINANDTSFQITTNAGVTEEIVNLTSNGNDFYYYLTPALANTTAANQTTDSFTGRLGNGVSIAFGANAGGALPTGVNAATTYYVINASGDGSVPDPFDFQITTVAGAVGNIVDFTTDGSNFYYSIVPPPRTNDSFGVNLLGGRLDLRNVDYLTPETMYFEGGQILVPARTTSSWAGDFQMNVNGNVTINENGKLILNGNLLGNRAFIQLGEGTMVLRGEALVPATTLVSDSFRRSYILQAGTLELDYSDNNFSHLVDNATLQMGGSRRGGVLRLTGGSHEEIVNNLSLQAGNNQIYRDDGSSIIRLNTIARAVGSSLYFDLARIAKVDNANTNNILGAWALIRDANVQAYWMIPGSIDVNFTVDPNTDTFTSTQHKLANGNVVNLSNVGGALPGGLSPGTPYYVVAAATSTFRLSATLNGMAIDIFNAGTGTQSLTTVAPNRRVSTTTLTFAAHADNYPGSTGNGKIEVEIAYAGGTGPISATLTGSGTLADPYHYKITTTEEYNSTDAIVEFVSTDSQVQQILTVSKFPTADDAVADTTSYPPTFLAGGAEDSGSKELDWAKNALTGTAANDGFVVPNGIYSNNSWGVNVNTNISSSFSRVPNSITYTLRFANSGAATVNLLGGINTVQTGGILISPTIGANDSAIAGVGQLTTQNQGNLQNFLLHQFNTQGDLVISAPIVDRLPFARTGRLSSNIIEANVNVTRRLINSLSSTADLAPGMTVSGTGIAVPSVIVEIVDLHTIKLDRDTTQVSGERNLLTFTGGPVAVPQRLGTISHLSDRRRIYGITIPANPLTGAPEQLSTSDLYVGMPISGPGIPAGALVAVIVNDADITINIDHFFTGIVSALTFTPSIGIEKLGPGTTVLAGANTYSNVTFIGDGILRAQSLTDGGVAGSLGISNNAVGNLVFNGGTLQYVGEDSSTNRGLTLTEFAVLNIGHERTEATFSGAVSGVDRLEKSGSGTLIVKGNAGLSDLRVDEGTLRVQIVDTNPAPATFTASNFGTSGLMSLRMAGGTLELRGTPEGNVAQTYGGPFYLEEGASEIRVVSVKGYDPNNLLNLAAQIRSTALTLMGGEEVAPVIRSSGATMRFIEDPMRGAGAASVLLNLPVVDRQRVLPWAVYRDNTSTLINDFATVLIGTGPGPVVGVDGNDIYDIGRPPAVWGDSDDISEGGIDPTTGLPRTIAGTLSQDRGVNTLRYFTEADAILTIASGATLRLNSGAILVGGNVRNVQKQIIGPGNLTGGAMSTEGGRDIILHNYNATAAFHVGANIIDDQVTLAPPYGGNIELGKRDLIFPPETVGTFSRLVPGMVVTGPGIPPGTVIVSAVPTFAKLVLNNAALSSQINQTYTFTSVTSFVQAGIGTTRLSGDNTYTGDTFVHGGV